MVGVRESTLEEIFGTFVEREIGVMERGEEMGVSRLSIKPGYTISASDKRSGEDEKEA